LPPVLYLKLKPAFPVPAAVFSCLLCFVLQDCLKYVQHEFPEYLDAYRSLSRGVERADFFRCAAAAAALWSAPQLCSAVHSDVMQKGWLRHLCAPLGLCLRLPDFSLPACLCLPACL
jgi:hypothetical protein